MSLREVEGVVGIVKERTVNTKRGPSSAFDMSVHTESGEEWFGCGFKNPGVSQGQAVKFVAKDRTYTTAAGVQQTSWDMDAGSLKVSRNAPAESSSPRVVAAAQNVDSRQRSIIYQSAYERAINLVNGALANGAITLPAKAALKFDVYKSVIHETALELAEMFVSPPTPFVSDEEIVGRDEESEVVEEGDDDEYVSVV